MPFKTEGMLQQVWVKVIQQYMLSMLGSSGITNVLAARCNRSSHIGHFQRLVQLASLHQIASLIHLVAEASKHTAPEMVRLQVQSIGRTWLLLSLKRMALLFTMPDITSVKPCLTAQNAGGEQGAPFQ